MAVFFLAVLCGLASGRLVVAAGRWPALAWIALAPLGVTTAAAPPVLAALAAALAGAIASASTCWDPTLRRLVPLAAVTAGVSWGATFGVAALAIGAAGGAWLAVALPAAAALAPLPLRLLGAPRWVSNPVACTQERWLAVVHIARAGGDLAVTATIALAGAALALGLLAHGDLHARIAVAAALGGVLTALAFGAASLRAARRRVASAPTTRVAAVVVDGVRPEGGDLTGLWPIVSPEYRNVDATLARYAPWIDEAAAAGARLIVLPEVAVSLKEAERERWLDGVAAWARAHRVAIVAPYFDASAPRNRLAVVDERGVVAAYEKQHPGRGLEPPREERTPPGPHSVRARGEPLALSTVICVDLDYGDLVGPVRGAGGLLAAPSNDWHGEFAERHNRTAVWSAVLTGVTLVRATGHGISAVLDGAGRVVAQRSSRDGPVVLIADAPS